MNTLNADPAELQKFSELAHRWWDPASEFKPLHDINPLRLGWIDGKAALAMKPTLLISASPGALGGMRGSVLTRAMLTHLGLWLLPQTVAVGNAGEAFSADGALPADKEKQLNLALRALLRAARA